MHTDSAFLYDTAMQAAMRSDGCPREFKEYEEIGNNLVKIQYNIYSNESHHIMAAWESYKSQAEKWLSFGHFWTHEGGWFKRIRYYSYSPPLEKVHDCPIIPKNLETYYKQLLDYHGIKSYDKMCCELKKLNVKYA